MLQHGQNILFNGVHTSWKGCAHIATPEATNRQKYFP
jgi:hypothetical protein